MPYSYKEYVKPLFILCSLSLVLSLYNQTDTFILGFLNEEKTEVASYSVGIKGIDIIIGIIAGLSTVFIPRSAYYYNQPDKKYFNNLTKYSMNICFFIVMPAIVTMCCLARPICSLISGNFDYSPETGQYVTAPTILITLSSMMLTYSLGDIIYGQILLPMKKEKYYLIAMGIGTVLNVGLSIFMGGFLPKYVSWMTPSIGVAIGTAVTDLLMLVFLLSITWKWVKSAIFNMNTLKILIANILILAASLLLYKPLNSIWTRINVSLTVGAILQMVSIVLIDAIIYIVFCAITKENLVYSFIRKDKKEIEA